MFRTFLKTGKHCKPVVLCQNLVSNSYPKMNKRKTDSSSPLVNMPGWNKTLQWTVENHIPHNVHKAINHQILEINDRKLENNSISRCANSHFSAPSCQAMKINSSCYYFSASWYTRKTHKDFIFHNESMRKVCLSCKPSSFSTWIRHTFKHCLKL